MGSDRMALAMPEEVTRKQLLATLPLVTVRFSWHMIYVSWGVTLPTVISSKLLWRV